MTVNGLEAFLLYQQRLVLSSPWIITLALIMASLCEHVP